jgi:hypothetical protein
MPAASRKEETLKGVISGVLPTDNCVGGDNNDDTSSSISGQRTIT